MANFIGGLFRAPGTALNAVENVIQGVGEAAVELPNLARVIIRVLDSSRYIALLAVTGGTLYLLRKK
jgi:hypothetical protein